MNEAELIKERYSRRNFNDRYSFMNPDIYMKFQERERKLIRLLKQVNHSDVSNVKVLEVGCGSGTNLVELILMGFTASNLTGIDLLPERIEAAAKRLPSTVKLICGDALQFSTDSKFDIIYLSTVFSSILDANYRIQFAEKIWSLLKPGGGILWYDFLFNNPQNSDVRGVSNKELNRLFPGKRKKYRITLAPPVARKLAAIHPVLLSLANLVIPLRTHIICWIDKEMD